MDKASVLLVDEVDDDFNHCVLFLSAAFCYHKGKGDEGVVGNALCAVFVVENAIAVEEPQEQCGGNAFVAVTERVVFGNEIQEHGGFLLH